MRIAIFGTGAVGGYFGGRLAEAGEDVVFIARGKQLEALQSKGLTIRSPEGDCHLEKVEATGSPAEAGPVDVVIAATKAWQLRESLESMQPLIGEGTLVVPLQNGVEAPSILASAFGRPHVAGGVCRIACTVGEPGTILHLGLHPTIEFGELDNRSSDRIRTLRERFDRATGLTATVAEDIHVTIWKKFLFVEPLGAIGGITRVPAGVFRSVPESRHALEALMEEIVTVGRAHNVALDDGAVVATMKAVDSIPSATRASMQRDLEERRPSELDDQLGAMLRLGAEKQIAVPLHLTIHSLLLPGERIARGEIEGIEARG
ncbi:MAG: 2-dehydropantoate 2-reductase [Thermoanaerobaculia bacterium]